MQTLTDFARLDVEGGMRRVRLVERIACAGPNAESRYLGIAGDLLATRAAAYLLREEYQTARLLAFNAVEHGPTEEFFMVLCLVDRFLDARSVGPSLAAAFPELATAASADCWSLADATVAACTMMEQRRWREAEHHRGKATILAAGLGRLAPVLIASLLDQFRDLRPERRGGAIRSSRLVPVERPNLTGRERMILEAIGSGMSNKAIARENGVTPETVKTHMRNLFLKLDVHTRTEAYARAAALGLISAPSGERADQPIPAS